MRKGSRVTVLIPALNEELSIGRVLGEIPDWVDEIIVADNGSTDRTIENAKSAGATVVQEPHRGYGSACLCGIASIRDTDIVVFLDGDYSDFPAQMDRLVDPIASGDVDMVIGSRVRGHHQRGALTPQARFGNALACFLLRLFWGVRYTDLGPFRAIRYSTLTALDMQDPDYGWTVEMQIKAALSHVRTLEVPVDYRRRIGVSKVSGTVRGVVGAGYKILSTIFISAARHYVSRRATP
ncbi:MAG: glycosyltransferase family 2 protein, partial [Candidatus Hydrogenedentes bacterium]|nr:glycosyltransferase family 2 protein [Candidatus Hydrogenedentota bacterium]